MNLRDLDASLRKIVDERGSHRAVDDVTEADGVMFLCPLCFTRNGGPVGTHRVICWSPKVLQTLSPGPGRWPLTGTSIDDLTLSPSIALGDEIVLGATPHHPGGCRAHFFVRNGAIEGLT
jgi:hypothetical protein